MKTEPQNELKTTETVKPKHTAKDSVFKSLFSRSEYLLQLYRSLHPEDTEITENDITDITLESVLAGREYNDLGFTVKDKFIILVEAQSTWTENIIVRSLIYLIDSLKGYLVVRKANLYSTKKVRFPKPELYVIYTKDRAGHPDVISLKDAYFPNEECCIDVKIKVIYDDESDSITSQYIGFCKVFDDCRKKYGYTRKTIDETLRICADKNLLKQYLKEHEAEVIEMMTLLFDQDYVTDAYNNEIRQNALNEGIGIGEARGEARGELSAFCRMVKSGIISAKQAADSMNISVGEFRQRAGSLL